MRNPTVLWILLAALIMAASSGLAHANPTGPQATWTVTKPADTNDGACNSDCSLREAVRAANAAGGANTITIPAGTYTLSRAGADEDAAATGDLDLTAGTITINGAGAGATFIDGAGLDRVFDISGGAAVSMAGLTIQHGKLTNNYEIPGSGAGVRTLAGRLSLSNVTLRDNQAILYGGAIMHGFRLPFSGASPAGPLSLSNVTISDNLAPAAGGAIFLGEAGALTIGASQISGNRTDGTNVVNNSPFQGGGAVFAAGGGINGNGEQPSVVTISGTTFSQNTSANDNTATGGGAIYAATSLTTVSISGSTFSGNKTMFGPAGFGGAGGAIGSDGTTMTISGSVFENNTTQSSGGAIYAYGGALTISGSQFSQNSTTGDDPISLNCGGALKAENSGVLRVTNASFSANTAEIAGGAICLKGEDAILTRLTMNGNSAATGAGGAIFNTSRVSGSPVKIIGSLITANHADGSRGGGIENGTAGDMEISDSYIGGNSAYVGGGISNYTSFGLKVTASGVSFNTAEVVGGGVYTRHDVSCSNNVCPPTPLLSDVTLNGNQATGTGGDNGGGGIYSEETLKLSNVTLSDNSAQNGGGILTYQTPRGDYPLGLDLSNVTLSGNSSRASGGGIYLGLGVAQLNNVTVAGNSAADSGGGIYNDPTDSPSITIKNSLLADNSASAGPDCAGQITSANYNLIEAAGGCTLGGATANNITGSDPALGALADNGGPTMTQALGASSPALNHGNPTAGSCAARDQRGAGRSGACDIGAYEAAPASADLKVSASAPGAVAANGNLTYTVTASNVGPGPSQAVSLGATLPAGATFVSAYGNGWFCLQNGSSVGCTHSGLGVAAAAPVYITIAAPSQPGPISATMTVSSSTADPNGANNATTVSSTVGGAAKRVYIPRIIR
jgi:CSLREA domain-containing protein/uncharacterized repeat protein (TIGR01451 family)